MDMENLLMEMVMKSTRRDRLDDAHPHEGRRPRLRDRRRRLREGERTEPEVAIQGRPEGVPPRENVLLTAFRRFLRR
jgi:hypothetical protein